MPFFSVVIPLFNKAAYVEDTLNSVIKQTYSDFEIIVINDGSTDDSLEKVSQFEDERLTIHTIENCGVSTARNIGVEKAKTNYIVFLDADDLWQSNHLQVLKKLIDDFPESDLYCMGYHKRKSKKSNIRAVFGSIENRFRGYVKDYFENSLPFTIAGIGAVAIDKNVFLEHRGFSETVTHGEDIELWTKIALNHTVALHNIPTVTHQLHVESRVSNKNVLLKKFPDYSQFNHAEASNASLKKYLDQNRYAIALSYRLSGDENSFKSWMENIDLNSLNVKQRTLLKLPNALVTTLQKTHRILLEKGLYLSTYR